MKTRSGIVLVGVLSLLLQGAFAADEKKSAKPKKAAAFGALRSPTREEAQEQTKAWLEATGKRGVVAGDEFEKIWNLPDRSILERVTETICLVHPEAAKAWAEANASTGGVPQAAPTFLKDAKQPLFLRANFAVAYAKALSKRRVYEEALEALKPFKAEQVVDPAAYLFHRAVAEHSLLLKDDASRSLARLLDDVEDAPDRYKLVAALMYTDMQSWRDKDLAAIGRKMDNVERRLELSRGGPQTQKLQKELLARLDELIKKLENQADGESASNANACPNGKPMERQQMGKNNDPNRPNDPLKDSQLPPNSGTGKVDPKKLDGIAKQWGKLPEKERVKAMQELVRDMPPEYRELIETYFRKLAQSEAAKP